MTMSAQESAQFQVAVIGAGPAGLFAARELAQQGAAVTLINRDLKPGGLAEYGIYPTKTKMKDGLRSQFRQILALPEIAYRGLLSVGQTGDLSLDDLRSFGFDAILVTVGAQGTKWLGLPGEQLSGVYHAKELVYSYNQLPPFSGLEFRLGKRAAVIGVGNVMLDVTHWLLEEAGVEEIVAIARRGPAEVKFDKKELESVVHYLDMPSMEAELERVRPEMLRLGQDPTQLPAVIQQVKERVPPPARSIPNHFHIQFLASPARILGDEHGRVSGLEVEETSLALKPDGETSAHGLGILRTIPADCVIFAIGDGVDEQLGLPVQGIEFVKNLKPRFPVDGVSYEVFDPQAGSPIADVFVAGWARKASTGLVGVARRDGAFGARALLSYLQTLPAPARARGAALEQLDARLAETHKPCIGRDELLRLEAVERSKAAEQGLESFRFSSNADMVAAIGANGSAPRSQEKAPLFQRSFRHLEMPRNR